MTIIGSAPDDVYDVFKHFGYILGAIHSLQRAFGFIVTDDRSSLCFMKDSSFGELRTYSSDKQM